jgi:Matrixin
MAKTLKVNSKNKASNPFEMLDGAKLAKAQKSYVHLYGEGLKCKCRTEPIGYATPGNKILAKLKVDASLGFIPLWERGTILRWRFQENSFSVFADPAAAQSAIRQLIGNALVSWGDAVPVTFSEQKENWHFEVSMRDADDCDQNGSCTLASAFFPDSGRHTLDIYPKMFKLPAKEQNETLVHELGHVFGLRHFFALTSEKAYPAEVFGTDDKFSIMNYGAYSELTDNDRSDLKHLYQMVWEGSLTDINGTKIRLVRPHHA